MKTKETQVKIKQLRKEADKLEATILAPKKKIIRKLKEEVKKVSKSLQLEWDPKSRPEPSEIKFFVSWMEGDDIYLSHDNMENEIEDVVHEYRLALNKEFDRWIAKCPELLQRNREIKKVCEQIDECAAELGMDKYDLMRELGML